MFRKKTFIAGMVAAGLAPAIGFAQQPVTPGTSPGSSTATAPTEPAAAPTPEHNFTGNVGLFSQYIFRGLTQTNRDPAVQGGFDYAHKSGFYVGTWASNISWLRENSTAIVGGAPFVQGTYNEGGSLEWDFYGGYKGTIGDFGYDLGTLYYFYPGKINPAVVAASKPFAVPKADTWEVYGAASWKWLAAKYSYGVMNKTFGVADSQGSYYIDLSANVPLGDYVKPLTGVTLNAHWGYQKYSGTDPRNFVIGGVRQDNDRLYSYKDVKLGLTYALPKDFTVGAFYSKAYDANVLGYGAATEIGAGGNRGVYPRNIAKSTGTVFLQKTF